MKGTLRRKLVTGTAIVTIVTLAAAMATVYAMNRRSLLAELDETLASKSRSLAVLVRQESDQIEIEFQRQPLQEFARKVRPEYYQLWHEDGRTLARSRRLNDGNLPRIRGSRVSPGKQFVTLPDGRAGRLVTIEFLPHVAGETLGPLPDELNDDSDSDHGDAVDFAGRVRVTLAVAAGTDQLTAALANQAWSLLVISLVAMGLMLTGLNWLIDRVLQPLNRLAAQIQRVDAQSLGCRLDTSTVPAEIRAVVERLNDLLQRLEHAFDRERTFSSDVAHELRTPLSGIRSTLEVTLRRPRDKASYLEAIEECVAISDDMQRIVETLLSVARIESGHANLELQPVDVSHLISRSWRPFTDRAVAREVNVNCDYEPVFVLTDSTQLQVVLSNLFDNAVCYVDHGGCVQIETEMADPSLVIRVSNSGCRLTKEECSHVFERFWQADSARAATGVHAGLGLALSRQITQLLGYEIRAATDADRFIMEIRIPRAHVRDQSAGEMSNTADHRVETVKTVITVAAPD